MALASSRDPFQRGMEAGIKEGKRIMARDMVTWLEHKYMAPDAPDRGTPEAEAILKLTRELSEELRGRL